MSFEELVKTWWFSGLIIALVINLASSYLKPILDRLFAAIPVKTKGFMAKRSAVARERILNQRQVRERRLKYLQEHPEAVAQLRMVVLQYQTNVFLSLILGFVWLCFITIILPKDFLQNANEMQMQSFGVNVGLVVICMVIAYVNFRRWAASNGILTTYTFKTYSEDISNWHKPE